MQWYPDWRGKTCVVMASGPSLQKAQVEKVRHLPTVVVNTTWRMAPWAEVLYACDWRWWHEFNGVPEFRGIKVTQDDKACKEYPDIHRVVLDSMHKISVVPGRLGCGANGGFQALNLAIQFGPERILLLGYDMHRNNGKSHWHGDHPKNLINPAPANMARWAEYYDANAEYIESLGVEVINCSPGSAIRGFPKMDVAEALERVS